MERTGEQTPNRPASLEASFRQDFYTSKHRIRMDEVGLKPVKNCEGVRAGWYDFGNTVLGWGLTEISPGGSGPMHRHASEAQIFIYQGSGFSTVNDVRVDWEEGDVIRVPLYAWHQHTNTGAVPVIWLKHTSAALYNRLGMLMRDAKPDFTRADVSIFKDDFKPY